MQLKHQYKNHKIKPASKQQREQLMSKYKYQKYKQINKSSLCRFYLRGLCIFKGQDCPYAHSISQLNYRPYQNQKVQQEYLGTDFDQKPLFLQKRNYINLIQYIPIIQKNNPEFPFFTPQQVNDQKDATYRRQVRTIFHRDHYNNFMQLIRQTYPQANLTQSFIQRQYTRVGFNKTMTRIKFGFLQNFILKTHFKINLLMPPYKQKTRTFIFKKPTTQQSLQSLKILIARDQKFPIKQPIIRKFLYTDSYPGMIPFRIFLTDQKMTIQQFLQFIQKQALKFKQQYKIQRIFDFNTIDQQATILIIIKQLKQFHVPLIGYQQIKKITQKNHKQTNKFFKVRDLIKQVLYKLMILNHKVFYHNSFSLVYFQEFDKSQGFYQDCCSCQYSKNPSPILLRKFQQVVYYDQRVVLIDCLKTLQYAQMALDKQKIVSVDLQGWLSKYGYIQLVQIGIKAKQTNQILVFDILMLREIGIFQQTRLLLKALFQDNLIKKIFHDSRNDSLAIHNFFQSCIVNSFDTSITHIFIEQSNLYPIKSNPTKVFQKIQIVKHPGINNILKTYQAPGGINTLKQKFHKQFNQKKHVLSRPIDPQFLQYSVKDVQDLIDVYWKMNSLISPNISARASAKFAAQGWQALIKQQE